MFYLILPLQAIHFSTHLAFNCIHSSVTISNSIIKHISDHKSAHKTKANTERVLKQIRLQFSFATNFVPGALFYLLPLVHFLFRFFALKYPFCESQLFFPRPPPLCLPFSRRTLPTGNGGATISYKLRPYSLLYHIVPHYRWIINVILRHNDGVFRRPSPNHSNMCTRK